MFIEVVNPDESALYKRATKEAQEAYFGKTGDEDVFLIHVHERQIIDLDWFWSIDGQGEERITMEKLNDYID